MRFQATLCVSTLLCVGLVLLSPPASGDEPSPAERTRPTVELAASVGVCLGAVQLGEDYNRLEDRWGTIEQQIFPSVFLSGEYVFSDFFGASIEGGVVAPSATCRNCVPLALGYKNDAIISQRMFPITLNARFRTPGESFYAFASLGAGIAPGMWDELDDEDDQGSLLGIPIQAAVGVRYFFSRTFGMGVQVKYFYIKNTSDLEYHDGMRPAVNRDIGLLGAYLDFAFGL